MKGTLLALTMVLTLVGSSVLAPVQSAEADPPETGLTLPVTGTLPGGGTFLGDLTVTGLEVNEAGQLLVNGVLTGTATVGGVVTEITQTFSGVIGSLTAEDKCDILHLDLAPIHLDLLGLDLDISQIVIDLEAIPGSGNLLGNLLCAVTRLLDRGGPLQAIGNLLDVINRLRG